MELILPAWRRLFGVLPAALNAVAANMPMPWDELPNVSLPAPEFADMEASTNRPLPNLARCSGQFVFSLGCLATPTNNVEVAFGTDENANGVLEAEEVGIVVGWDAGRWCVKRDFVEVASSAGASAVGSVQTLTWVLDVDSNGAPVGLDAHVDGAPLFSRLSAQPPAWLHKAGWNMMRLTGRGIARHGDSFRFGFVNADGLVLKNERLKVENEKLIAGVGIAGDHTAGTLHSPLSTLHSSTVSDNDIAAGWRLDAVGGAEADFAARRPTNAVVYEPWRLRGAHIDGFRIPAVDWMFRSMHDGFLDGVTVCSWGEIRPHVATNYFPRPFPDADLSLLPLAKWGLLPHRGEGSEESLFWHAATPSNSLMLTWRNAAYGRDANCPTNFQAEIFPDGGFVYRYDDRTERYVAVSPWDWDGDGLENSVDLDPKTAGADAHGTNAEWYNTVCSNVFTQIEQSNNPNNRTILLPNGESVCFKSGVNTNAYYFVDVMAEDGPAPIYFGASQPGRLGSPVVMALAGATNHVPLLIGVEYAVTSPAPFTVSAPTNGFAEVVANNGSSSAFTVKWPLEFMFTEEVSGTGRSYTVGVGPYDPGGSFSWGWDPGGATLQSVDPSASGGVCSCVSGSSDTVTFSCSPSCTCGGNCRAVGAFSFEYAVFAVTGGECRCGFDDSPAPDNFIPTPCVVASPSMAVSFSSSAVMFENCYENRQGESHGRRSTRVCISVTAYGGQHGGVLTVTSANLSALQAVAGTVLDLPGSLEIPAGVTFHTSAVFEGRLPSAREGDIEIAGAFCENETGDFVFDSKSLTSIQLTYHPHDVPEANSHAPNRHVVGVRELVHCGSTPELNSLFWVPELQGQEELFEMNNDEKSFYCPWTGGVFYVSALYFGNEYRIPFTVLEPTAECRECEWRDDLIGNDGEAGMIGMLLHMYVKPDYVSFEYVECEEIPVDETDMIPPYGYFAIRPGLIPPFHSRQAGAGNWEHIKHWRGYWTTDHAQVPRTLPPLEENPSRWATGMITWDIPLGWGNSIDGLKGEMLPRPPHQIFLIDEHGTVMILKHGHSVSRTVSGRIKVDGKIIRR